VGSPSRPARRPRRLGLPRAAPGRALSRQPREVGRDEGRCRVGHGLLRRAARDAREDERERPAERGGERAVGRRPVTHHDALVAEPLAHQRDGRGVRLAGDLGIAARRGRDRRDDRARARQQPAGHRVRGVGVGRDEPGAGTDRVGRRRQPVEVEVAVEPDDDRGRRRPGHHFEPRLGARLDDARPRAREHAAARCDLAPQERGGRLRARQHVARSRLDTHPGELGEVVADAPARVVGDERDAQARAPHPCDRGRGAGDRFLAAPDDPVEVAAADRHACAPPASSAAASARA
jgi:hypothetical protein